MSYLQLGASLYVPATRLDLAEIANQRRYPNLRSIIFCTEDAVASESVAVAIANLQRLLPLLEPLGIQRFIRVRSPEVLRTLIAAPGVELLDGFVLPKVTRHNLHEYTTAIPAELPLALMPTLETAEVFDAAEMKTLCRMLLADRIRERILCLRIGANDLLHLLGLRRARGGTIYETPLSLTISQLITIFRPAEFSLTAPVFDRLDDGDTLAREVRMDIDFGLLGKTAIHPSQIVPIESHYVVANADWEMARRILQENAPPVFRHADTMCEPATHRRWAERILERARIYGIDQVVSDENLVSLNGDLTSIAHPVPTKTPPRSY